MSQRVEAVLNASGLRGPALASLEGGSGLFALTGEHLIFHDGHGTRRVTLRDLARIHSDAEGTLRVETPAGVAMSASLIGFDGDAVQQFFSQVRDVTARVKSLTPPPLAPASPAGRSVPRAVAAAPQPAPTQPAHAPDPDQGVSVTPVRHPDTETQRLSGPAPRITINRGGQREQLAADARTPRENGLGLSGAVGTALGRNLPPPGSVEIRAVRHPAAGQAAVPAPHPAAAEPVRASALPLSPEQDETAEREPMEQEQPAALTGATLTEPLHTPRPPAPAQPTQAPAPALHYTGRDLGTQAGRVRGVPGRLRLLAAVLLVGAVITALLMFGNAQRLLALWVLIAGIVGAIALLSLAELAQLQTIQAAVLAGSGEAEGETAEDETAGAPANPQEARHAAEHDLSSTMAQPERQG